MENNSKFTIKQQLACVEDEIKMRHKVYSKLVARGGMTLGEKEHKIAAMTAVYNTLILFERQKLNKLFNQIPVE